MKYYAGIGSRETPYWAGRVLRAAGEALAKDGWWMRSGGAPAKSGFDSADKCFEEGAKQGGGQMSIYLPNSSFYGQNANSPYCIVPKVAFPEAWMEAMQIAEQFHPNWQALLRGQYPNLAYLMARNVFQVLGDDLKTPSRFVLCYAKSSSWEGLDNQARIVDVKGGTGQAVRIAASRGIPVYNIAEPEHLQKITQWLGICYPEEAKPFTSKVKP